MESDDPRDSLRAQLDEIERGEQASWVVYPPTPLRWPVGFGCWAAAFTLVVGSLDGIVQALTELVLVLVLLAMMAWDRRRRGTYPNGRPPRELHGAILRMVLGAVVVGGLGWLLGERVSIWLAALVTGIGAFAVVAWYEHEYAV